MVVVTSSQQFVVSVAPVDKRGNTAEVETVQFSSSNPSVLTVEQDASDPLKATVKAVGPLGTGQINVTADAKIGDEVGEISGVLDVEVKAGEAVSLTLNTEAPSEQV